MRTPYGQECKYYYSDFYRGRSQEECRLAAADPKSEPWNPDICRGCPVPAVLMANACEHMVLEGGIVKGWFGFGRKMRRLWRHGIHQRRATVRRDSLSSEKVVAQHSCQGDRRESGSRFPQEFAASSSAKWSVVTHDSSIQIEKRVGVQSEQAVLHQGGIRRESLLGL